MANEIEQAFPFVDMPSFAEIPNHDQGCHECSQLAEDVDALRGRPIGGEEIRQLHQELSHLSAKSWQWLLPHYLRYCATPEAEYNKFETEFLIYSLSPLERFEGDANNRLKFITDSQIQTLLNLLRCFSTDEYWGKYCPAELQRGISFLKKVLVGRRVPRSE